MEKQLKVLVVDDDVDFVRITKAMLEKSGYVVVTAFNGQEGREKARSERPDLIILDAMMETETEGFHVAYDIRKDAELKATPIIMLTAINMRDFPWKVEKDETWLPVDVFLDKPVSSERLVAEVDKVLRGSG